MREQRCAAEQNFKNYNSGRMDAEREHGHGLYTQTDQRLARVKAQARTDIKGLLCVMGGTYIGY